jgi:hypothetical protein
MVKRRGPPSHEIADALNDDRAGVNVTVMDFPAFLPVLWRPPADEGRHVL